MRPEVGEVGRGEVDRQLEGVGTGVGRRNRQEGQATFPRCLFIYKLKYQDGCQLQGLEAKGGISFCSHNQPGKWVLNGTGGNGRARGSSMAWWAEPSPGPCAQEAEGPLTRRFSPLPGILPQSAPTYAPHQQAALLQ